MATGKVEGAGEVAGQNTQTRSSILCCYSQRVCNLEKLKGFDFCHKHILEDKASPFKPCDFYAKTNERRCMNPAPKIHDKEKSYCIIHTRKAELRRAVEKRRKKRQRNSSTMEEDVEDSAAVKRRRTSSSASQKSIEGSQKDDEGHSSDEEVNLELGIGGSLKVDSAWHGDVDSDAESVDSEEEDALRHAGVWTLDEASKICCDKMVRLKSLYMAQYKRLFHVLKEKRRKYLQVIQAEQENDTVETYLSPSEILSPPVHRKHHGVEAILHKQAKEKRHGISPRHQNLSHQRCTHVGEGIRCPNKILPLTKYCIHHISHDPNQLLFQNCSFKTADQKTCTNMVPKIYPHSSCQLHMRLTVEPMRSDLVKDLEEAKKKDKEKKAILQQTKEGKRTTNITSVANTALALSHAPEKQLPIPKALQDKSSALIQPLASVSKETSSTTTLSPVTEVSNVAPTETKPPLQSLKVEQMEVDSPGSEVLLKQGISSDSTPMEVLSPASVDSSSAGGVQNISPTLLAASLVAVCSGAPAISVTSPLATSSTTNESLLSDGSIDSKKNLVASSSASTSLASSSVSSADSAASSSLLCSSTTSTSTSVITSSTPSSVSSLTISDSVASCSGLSGVKLKSDTFVPSTSNGSLPLASSNSCLVSKIVSSTTSTSTATVTSKGSAGPSSTATGTSKGLLVPISKCSAGPSSTAPAMSSNFTAIESLINAAEDLAAAEANTARDSQAAAIKQNPAVTSTPSGTPTITETTTKTPSLPSITSPSSQKREENKDKTPNKS